MVNISNLAMFSSIEKQSFKLNSYPLKTPSNRLYAVFTTQSLNRIPTTNKTYQCLLR